MTDWYRWDGGDLVLTLRVQPRASRDRLLIEGERLRVQITAPPVDGAANAHLLRFLASEFGIATSRTRLVRGATGRDKVVRVAEPRRLPPLLGAALSRDRQA
ncbi:MAG TPA: DUF167 family protein [Candidatus Acidoferrales bacterium]|nr:DUF167 family protein [Candidatus Acidoferrales bacterium]